MAFQKAKKLTKSAGVRFKGLRANFKRLPLVRSRVLKRVINRMA